mmetsp:Transcript_91929/g.159490  ORF Transcript_91929/g.159490 Transcript_91929/m.159490 type:complete len:263 (+) Transcript_91929:38-826(+)
MGPPPPQLTKFGQNHSLFYKNRFFEAAKKTIFPNRQKLGPTDEVGSKLLRFRRKQIHGNRIEKKIFRFFLLVERFWLNRQKPLPTNTLGPSNRHKLATSNRPGPLPSRPPCISAPGPHTGNLVVPCDEPNGRNRPDHRTHKCSARSSVYASALSLTWCQHRRCCARCAISSLQPFPQQLFPTQLCSPFPSQTGPLILSVPFEVQPKCTRKKCKKCKKKVLFVHLIASRFFFPLGGNPGPADTHVLHTHTHTHTMYSDLIRLA